MPFTETPIETPADPTQQPPVPPAAREPVRIVAGRYGELDTHELITLLDSIEDERARSRFRESLYISIFVWCVVAWIFTYGQRYWWHPPQLKVSTDMHDRELTQLNLPSAHVPTPAIKPAPRPTIDSATMDHLREMSRQPTPQPPAPQPVTPAPAAPAPPPVAAVPQPHAPPPILAEAPTAQPQRPAFGSQSNALPDAAHSIARGGGGFSLPRPSAARNTPLNLGGVEVLSDTQGVDFSAYLKRVYYDVYRNWLPLIPQETLPPLSKEGETYITFSILPDGTIGNMRLDGSSHDVAIDRSCWGSITTEGQFPPLPSQFHGPNLTLRYHYIVSKNPPEY